MISVRLASYQRFILRVTMICDFTQIQGGPQISFLVNLWVSLNLWEKTEFTKGDDARHNEVSSEAEIHPKGMLGIILASKTLFAWLPPSRRANLLSHIL